MGKNEGIDGELEGQRRCWQFSVSQGWVAGPAPKLRCPGGGCSGPGLSFSKEVRGRFSQEPKIMRVTHVTEHRI